MHLLTAAIGCYYR